jgi:hypothetical protein
MKMNRLKPLMLGLVLCLGSAAATVAVFSEEQSNENETSAPTAQKNPATSSGRVVCRREAVIGSMIKKTVCHTAAQEAEIRAASQDAMHDLRGPNGSSSGG